MITQEQIQERIGKLEVEKAGLQVQHDRMVADRNAREQQFQQIVMGNQNRFQQINGAIAQLTELLNGSKQPTKEKKE